MKVFIADDSTVMRDRIKELFSDIKGISLVGEAKDVPTTIEGVMKLKPDILILDIRMPGGSGLDVLKKVKENPGAPTVIIFTNYPFPEYRDIATKLGAEYFFDKSSEFNQIKTLVDEMISNEKAKKRKI